mmetsp:Transcript_36668/g.82625  ORF Transcript_36668/g.82625 Transcript_36668/m.82625 type:complete len:224 (-) Transcript_36668:564-1235(-)
MLRAASNQRVEGKVPRKDFMTGAILKGLIVLLLLLQDLNLLPSSGLELIAEMMKEVFDNPRGRGHFSGDGVVRERTEVHLVCDELANMQQLLESSHSGLVLVIAEVGCLPHFFIRNDLQKGLQGVLTQIHRGRAVARHGPLHPRGQDVSEVSWNHERRFCLIILIASELVQQSRGPRLQLNHLLPPRLVEMDSSSLEVFSQRPCHSLVLLVEVCPYPVLHAYI